jgi:phenylacetic acid degradation operon negative regulatory protein
MQQLDDQTRPPFSPEVEQLLKAFHDQTPIRAWSMIITIFGDCVMPRGGTLWLGSLTRIMEAIDIGPGVVRTAMSRLAADNWLDRSKVGRNSYYRLTDKGAETFKGATRRIYFETTRSWDGQWIIGFLASGSDRAARREELLARGYGAIAPNVVVRPYTGVLPDSDPQNCVFSTIDGLGPNAWTLAEQGWPLEKISEGYHEFLDHYRAIDEALAAGQSFSQLESLIIRIMLIHDFRRLVLRDPLLPPSALPKNWPGDAARQLSARIYHRVMEASEMWLDSRAEGEYGPLPAPDFDFYRRFNAL